MTVEPSNVMNRTLLGSTISLDGKQVIRYGHVMPPMGKVIDRHCKKRQTVIRHRQTMFLSQFSVVPAQNVVSVNFTI